MNNALDIHRNRHRKGKRCFQAYLACDAAALVDNIKAATNNKTDRAMLAWFCDAYLQSWVDTLLTDSEGVHNE